MPSFPADADALALTLAAIAHGAGARILESRAQGFATRTKDDGSPCSDADIAAETFISGALARAFPHVSVISEESADAAAPLGEGQAFFLVDPLDGTRDFVAGGSEFTVNIAAVVAGRPIAGVIHTPADGRFWIGGAAAYATTAPAGGPPPARHNLRPIRTRPASREGLTALASARHGDPETDRFLAALAPRERRSASSALKFCLIAAGEADVYPRFGRTMQWDVAAGDALVSAAGGLVTTPDGVRLTYGDTTGGFANGPFIAWGDPALARDAAPIAAAGRRP
ncbi:3'-Phosphoadenosine 5'-phosphosulfate (PAPS) 3'-phosphatase [Chelatococcus sambhunathii]|uniref:3'(2'),5'-bisphosphate nucleotidase CysQ n=1 Tax=Chelatococcus sambhunathii TaxID=363953 RepID=A0ABM9U7G8_9HYPH|nr:3'(2'),5'-bisphosphate nucleotidase CysQ [Chelatococcus sambhunathii]CUA89537.1 3'-Phosphoadenosine 5'-phosphosulfate (PAPS) 3'-phosphatase [Chelatococcus sambhunathii]